MSNHETKESQLLPVLPARRLGRTSLQVFGTSVMAFMLREIKNQYGRSQFGYVWALAEPGAAVLIFTLLHALIGGGHGKIYQADPVIFFLFGVVPYFVFSNALSQSQGVCAAQRGLFNYRQVKPIDVILAKSLIDTLAMVLVLVMFIGIWFWLGMPLPQARVLELCGLFFAMYLFGLGTGLCFEVIGTIFEDSRKLFAVVMRPMFFVSGVFFTMDMLPEGLRIVLSFNPVLHGVDLVRGAALDGYESPGSLLYLYFWILGAHFVGLALYRRYQHRLI